MKVIDALKSGKPTLSFEFFPPKTKEQELHLFEVIAQLKKFNPDFASVTYWAMGTTREKTFYWVRKIKEKFQIEPVAHLTCIAATKDLIRDQIQKLEEISVENILELRGDIPEDQKDFIPPPDGFHYAKELVAFIKKLKSEFCLGVAGYPEGHPKATDLKRDTEYLKEKIEAGGEYIITQLFFDNHYFFDFIERCDKAKIIAPIIPGIMPITSFRQIKKMTEICGATIPPKLLKKLEKFEEDAKAIQQLGVEQALAQCRELRAAEVPGLHFFVLNQTEPISQILKELS